MTDGRRARGYRNRIRELLHKLASNTQHCSIEELLGAILKQCFVRAAVRCLPLLVDCVLDLCHLPVDKVLIGFLAGEQSNEDLACVVVSVLRNKLSFPRGLINF